VAQDPVCKMEVDPKKAAAQSSYQGQKIYFCDASPDKYMKA
jgi:YHS domain-containing protein